MQILRNAKHLFGWTHEDKTSQDTEQKPHTLPLPLPKLEAAKLQRNFDLRETRHHKQARAADRCYTGVYCFLQPVYCVSSLLRSKGLPAVDVAEVQESAAR